MGIVIVINFVASTLLAYFVSHMNQRVAWLNIACWGSAVCTGLYAVTTGLDPITGDAVSLFPDNRVNQHLWKRCAGILRRPVHQFLLGITFNALCESRS